MSTTPEVSVPQLHYENLVHVRGEYLKLRVGIRAVIDSLRGDVRNEPVVSRLHELLEGVGV